MRRDTGETGEALVTFTDHDQVEKVDRRSDRDGRIHTDPQAVFTVGD